MYAAHLGRFCSRDPIGYRGGLGLYTLVGSRPPCAVDPSGLIPPGFGSWELPKLPVKPGNWSSTPSPSNPPKSTNPPKAGCKCGVESFVVTYHRERTFSGEGTSLFSFTTEIRFKKDEDHDPAQCEFRQFVCRQLGLWLPQPDENGNPYLREFRRYDPTWKDDGYSRIDDLDGAPALAEPGFLTVDGPGMDPGTVRDDWNIKFIFTSQQAVYDIGRNTWVAATPPITVTVTGRHPRHYDGIPAGDKVYGVPDQQVFGEYK